VPEQNLTAVPARASPAKEVALLSRPAPEATPQDAVLQTEFPRQRGQHGRMAKGIGGIQHIQTPAETLRIGGAQQEVADE